MNSVGSGRAASMAVQKLAAMYMQPSHAWSRNRPWCLNWLMQLCRLLSQSASAPLHGRHLHGVPCPSWVWAAWHSWWHCCSNMGLMRIPNWLFCCGKVKSANKQQHSRPCSGYAAWSHSCKARASRMQPVGCSGGIRQMRKRLCTVRRIKRQTRFTLCCGTWTAGAVMCLGC